MAYVEFHWLQWGRDEFIAETPPAIERVQAKVRLQWGRDEFIAETTSFPAAIGNRTLLQWGRDEFIAETITDRHG